MDDMTIEEVVIKHGDKRCGGKTGSFKAYRMAVIRARMRARDRRYAE